MKDESTFSANVFPKAVMEPLGVVRRVFPIGKKKKKTKLESLLDVLGELLDEAKGNLPLDQIVRIVKVRDTREYEEVSDGVFKPIPGSGKESFCARCGRPHEVHAEVELADKRHVIVGTGCMMGSRLEKEAKTGAGLAKTIAKWEKQLESLRAIEKRYKETMKRVEHIPLPPVTSSVNKYGVVMWHMGDISSAGRREIEKESGKITDSDFKNLKYLWRKKRVIEQGFQKGDERAGYDADDLEHKLNKKKAALEMILKKHV